MIGNDTLPRSGYLRGASNYGPDGALDQASRVGWDCGAHLVSRMMEASGFRVKAAPDGRHRIAVSVGNQPALGRGIGNQRSWDILMALEDGARSLSMKRLKGFFAQGGE
jgi:hypothetical protein